jgi:carbonic anhydrase/acetyltransferase-like protein (isoleucine patch superfamily)
MIKSFEEHNPRLAEGVFVAADALVLGDVALGRDSSVWYGAVVRGDVHYIRIGDRTNIQDRCVVHVSTKTHPTVVGEMVTVGHGAILHGCAIGDRTLVGIGATVLDGVEVGEGSVIAAGSLLPPGVSFPARSLLVGSPAVVKRSVTEEELEWIRHSAEHYVELARRHARLPAPDGPNVR